MYSKVGMSTSYGWSGTQRKSEEELPKCVTNKAQAHAWAVQHQHLYMGLSYGHVPILPSARIAVVYRFKKNTD